MSALITQAVAVGCGMMAGLYFAFSTFIMRSLAEIPGPQGILAMQSINRVILRSPFMALFFGTSLAGFGLAVWGMTRWNQSGGALLIAGGLIYVIGHFVATAAFNVPLNDALDVVDPVSAEAARVWAGYLDRWTLWNHVRTGACFVSCALFLGAAWSMR